jgi:hypothetical protein
MEMMDLMEIARAGSGPWLSGLIVAGVLVLREIFIRLLSYTRPRR